MKSEQKSNSIAPIAIIGGVLVLAIIAFWWFYSSSTSQTAKSTSSSGKKADSTNSAELYAKASPGANPPHYLGAPNAAVTIEEFADFQCPTCAAMHPKKQEIRSGYGDRVRIIYREYP